MKKKNTADWENLLNDIMNSGQDFFSEVKGAAEDVYNAWLHKDVITNTGLHRKERTTANGTEDFIE